MMNTTWILAALMSALFLTSCISKKRYAEMQTQLQDCNTELGKCGEQLNDYMARLSACQEKDRIRTEQMNDLREQMADLRTQRDAQLNRVEDLTSLSQSATSNIKETLGQLERKDKYIHYLQAAKSRADSINLALAVNLKSVLRDGIEDDDVEVKVDKTVVFINLSDKMLYTTGSANITPRANEVLQKIATIVKSRPNFEVMVEGYTDNVPIKNECMDDNWDLSVKRATSVVRALQRNHAVDPNRLIAAGRGEYNTLATNATAEGRATNRRTRIIILPKLDEFYNLLDPNQVPD